MKISSRPYFHRLYSGRGDRHGSRSFRCGGIRCGLRLHTGRDTEGEIQYENFNASKAEFQISGVNVHPGSSKDVMVNASLVAMEINSMLPEGETPRDTDGYEGFYHLIDMKGDVGNAVLRYIIRDHDAAKFEERKETLRNIEKKDQSEMGTRHCCPHHNRPVPQHGRNHLRLYALDRECKKACRNAGVTPLILPIRGGTDGAQLSFKGLPCPNLGTGGHGYHGPYEHITVEGMDAACAVALELVKIYAEQISF